ncbi:MAG: hypothetical protein ABIZ81_12710 [Opitutaceae bacterium]
MKPKNIVFQNPAKALPKGISMTPTQVQLVPSAVGKINGAVSDTRTVLQALGLGTLVA